MVDRFGNGRGVLVLPVADQRINQIFPVPEMPVKAAASNTQILCQAGDANRVDTFGNENFEGLE
jgi:hypothetical protein